MITNYKCPKCGKNLYENNEKLVCPNIFCSYSISLNEYIEINYNKPDICYTLGKTDTNGKVSFEFCTNTNRFFIRVDKANAFDKTPCLYGSYSIDKISSIKVIEKESVIYELDVDNILTSADGVLFGSLKQPTNLFAKISNNKRLKYVLILSINDIKIPSFYIRIRDIDVMYKFIKTVEFFKSNLGKKDSE